MFPLTAWAVLDSRPEPWGGGFATRLRPPLSLKSGIHFGARCGRVFFVSMASSARGAFLIYQVYGAWVAGQVLATHRPWESWPVGPNTGLGLVCIAILFGMAVRLVKFIRRLVRRCVAAEFLKA